MLLGRKIGAAQPPFIVTTKDARELITLGDVLAAIDDAASSGCDAIKLGASPQRGIPWAWCAAAFQRASERGIALLARPDDEGEVSRFDWLGAVGFDIAFDVTDLDTIAAAARTGKPIVLAVGAASDPELAEIVEIAGPTTIALVLPTRAHADLARVDRLVSRGYAIGVSDVHADADLALAAVARGACVVELRRGDRIAIAQAIRNCERFNQASWATN